MGSSGKGLGEIALLLAIGALGLGVYQIILPSHSEGRKFYVVSNDDKINLDMSSYKAIPQLNITYNAKAGDSVLLEYNCQLKLDIAFGSTSIRIYFEIDSIYLYTNYIYLYGDSSMDYQDIYSSGIMKHYIQSSTAGEHTVRIITYIDEDYSTSYVRFNVLTVEVY